jgi:hypothetical protein
MELVQKFQQVSSVQYTSVQNLEVGRKFPIVLAERAETRYSPLVMFTLKGSSGSNLRVFLPKRYNVVVSDTDILDINCQKVLLYLISKGQCKSSMAYVLSIEKQDT